MFGAFEKLFQKAEVKKYSYQKTASIFKDAVFHLWSNLVIKNFSTSKTKYSAF